jgi:hypothetical protein
VTENELKTVVLDMAYKRGWYVYHATQGRRRGSQGKGYPDLTLARDGIVLWFELKQENGSMREKQRAWAKQLPEASCYLIRPAHIGDGTIARLLG